MKKNVFVNIALILIIAGLSYSAALYMSSRTPKEISPASTLTMLPDLLGHPAPQFSFTDRNDTPYKLTDFRGKVVILNFWASWCAPCVKEMPILIDVTNSFNGDVVLLGLSSDLSQDDMDRFLMRFDDTTQNDHIIFALDNHGQITRDKFSTYQLPETFLIDASGTVQKKILGADWTERYLREQLQNMLDETPQP